MGKRVSSKLGSDMILIESEEDLLSRELSIDGNETDQSGTVDRNGKGGEEASMTSNSSLLSVPKGLACMRQQHLDTINEGNSSIDISESHS